MPLVFVFTLFIYGARYPYRSVLLLIDDAKVRQNLIPAKHFRLLCTQTPQNLDFYQRILAYLKFYSYLRNQNRKKKRL